MATIGLFGTCGGSKWRNSFIEEYEKRGISYFNPQVDNWHPGLIEIENRHLREDEIILFPVTSETPGQGSLGETGYSIAAALRSNRLRYFIFMIEDECNDPTASPSQIADSNRSRKLVKSKLRDEARGCFNVFLVDTIEEMLHISISLHEICQRQEEVESSYTEIA